MAVLLVFVYAACTIFAMYIACWHLAKQMSCCSCSVLPAHSCKSRGFHLKQDLVRSDVSHLLYPCLHLAQWHVPQACQFMQCMLISASYHWQHSRPPQLQVARMQVHKRTLLELERFSTGALSAQLQKQQTDVRQTWKVLTALLDTATQLAPGHYLARHEPDAASIQLLSPVCVPSVGKSQGGLPWGCVWPDSSLMRCAASWRRPRSAQPDPSRFC